MSNSSNLNILLSFSLANIEKALDHMLMYYLYYIPSSLFLYDLTWNLTPFFWFTEIIPSMAFLQYYNPRRYSGGGGINIDQHHSKMIIVLWILMSTSYGLQVNKCCLESQLLGKYISLLDNAPNYLVECVIQKRYF